MCKLDLVDNPQNLYGNNEQDIYILTVILVWGCVAYIQNSA